MHTAPEKKKKQKRSAPTWNDSADQSRDALQLGHIVVDKILVACGIELRSIAEEVPQLGSDRYVVYNLNLITLVKLVVL